MPQYRGKRLSDFAGWQSDLAGMPKMEYQHEREREKESERVP